MKKIVEWKAQVDLVPEAADTGESLNVQFSPNLIESAHRVKSFSPDRPKNIVIKYVSRKMKDDILAAARIKKLSSPNRSLSIDAISKDLYISEHLSPENKILFKKTRDLAKTKSFKYVWIKNGNILIRKDESSRVKRIECEDDLKST
ncbi:hypothetical protein JTB14_011342 [Gonioctena quinquepunctata]|nr:hypothetical protein JTB14_011342 [Gonioctena quinquepunctata]